MEASSLGIDPGEVDAVVTVYLILIVTRLWITFSSLKKKVKPANRLNFINHLTFTYELSFHAGQIRMSFFLSSSTIHGCIYAKRFLRCFWHNV